MSYDHKKFDNRNKLTPKKIKIKIKTNQRLQQSITHKPTQIHPQSKKQQNSIIQT